MTAEKVSVVGLGKLGVCLAVCLARRGFEVFGTDSDLRVCELLKQKKSQVREPRLTELLEQYGHKITLSNSADKIVSESDISFIILPTPSTPDGSFSNAFLVNALKVLAQALKKKDGYHLFVIVSTVSPLSVEKELIPVLEAHSGKKAHKEFGICYSPEFIALGDVINGILNPDMILIGEGDKKAGDVLEGIYRQLSENNAPFARMNIVSAEIMKISLNAYITMKLSYVNTLGNICDRIGGADVDSITGALGLDRRISPKYLRYGPAFGGPCFPRDNRAFQHFARQVGIEAPLSEATDKVNAAQSERLLERVAKLIGNGKNDVVALYGLAYKPHTPVTEESPSVSLIRLLLERYPDIRIQVYDEVATGVTNDRIRYCNSFEDLLESATVLALMFPLRESKYKQLIRNSSIPLIDCWRSVAL